MMKLTHLFTTLSLFIYSGIYIAQQELPVVISGQIFNTDVKEISLSVFQGNNSYKDFTSTPLDEKGNFSINYTLPNKDFYVLRVGEQTINLAINSPDTIQVYGDGKNLLYYTNIIGNEASTQMMLFFREVNSFNTLRDSVQRVANTDPEKVRELDAFFRPKLQSFQNYRTSFIRQNTNSPALIAPLQSVDPMNEFDLYKSLTEGVIVAMEGSPTAASLKTMLEQQQQRYNASQFLGPGQEVPDIVTKDINGEDSKLSDLRGKIVLIDFWASWCGPCRRENPNVVKLYEKYKDAGFTIYSVSLDKSREPWVRAIESDKLTWPHHVSDLKGWGSDLAKLYKVSSIPFTVLIDKDGKVIQKNLRGQQLEMTLASIFGF
ncbi:hypothetical protein GCM10009118_12450 [Wandonia haliotis]|uniref:Thioredoxin domain-containing protein n=1 Tax=Wandonia haliotis TaxID=574963 RepID=A0ABP3Y250_9FLAO